MAFSGSAVEVWRERTGAGRCHQRPGRGEDRALAPARVDLGSWHQRGLRLVTVLDRDYPRRLLDIRETPPLLFARGDLRAEDPGRSVVGSRAASDQGRRRATAAAHLLVRKNLSVITRLAAGIDAAAHRAALTAGGRTVAILGTGIATTYPPAPARLQSEIGARGLLLSPFLPDVPPTQRSFPRRSAVMSGYGLDTIVIEAGETSGIRIQARQPSSTGDPSSSPRRLSRPPGGAGPWPAGPASRSCGPSTTSITPSTRSLTPRACWTPPSTSSPGAGWTRRREAPGGRGRPPYA